ncbi:MAG: glycosyltransferase family 2 protein [Muribaculaceae bacterium]|nr:glycosyltransferase family 2 protein [Muribaculaceae bacterium]
MIPTYGQEQYIGEAVRSAQAIDYPDLEIVIADDASPDATREVVAPLLDRRTRYHRNETNLGRVGNYHNTAHNVVSGEWLINLDGDDYFTSSSFITDAMDAVARLDDPDIVGYCYRHPNIDEIISLIPYTAVDDNRIVVSGKDYLLNYDKVGRFAHLSTIFRRDVGLRIGMYTLPWQACDFHSAIRIFLTGKIILDRRSVGYWRRHGANTTTVEADDKYRQAMLTYDAIEEFAKDYIPDTLLKEWRPRMNRAVRRDYIRNHVWSVGNFKSAYLLLAYPSMHWWWWRAWVRLLSGR